MATKVIRVSKVSKVETNFLELENRRKNFKSLFSLFLLLDALKIVFDSMKKLKKATNT